jgi:hypothetical protein
MAILVPVLQRVRRQAQAVVCQSKLKQWGMLWVAAVAENDGHMPLPPRDKQEYWFEWAWTTWGPYWGWGQWQRDSSEEAWNTEIKGIECCPRATKPANMGRTAENWLWAEFGAGGTFKAWGWIIDDTEWLGDLYYELPQNFYGSYGTNQFACPPHPDWDCVSIEAFWLTPDVRGANNIPVQVDSSWPWLQMWHGLDPPESDAIPDAYTTGRKKDNGACINRHDGFVNGLFMDWSVRKVGLKELWTLKWQRRYNTANRWTRAGGVRPEDWPEWMRGFKDY